MIGITVNPSSEEMLSDPYGMWMTIDAEVAEPELMGLYQRYALRAMSAWSGRNRNVFRLSKRIVAKLPRSQAGVVDNLAEWQLSRERAIRRTEQVQLPRVRMSMHGDIPVLFMEYVEPMTGCQIRQMFGAEPGWLMDVDGGQVGSTKDGRLVAYDFGVR